MLIESFESFEICEQEKQEFNDRVFKIGIIVQMISPKVVDQTELLCYLISNKRMMDLAVNLTKSANPVMFLCCFFKYSENSKLIKSVRIQNAIIQFNKNVKRKVKGSV
jgi:hypothetical protein